MDYPMLRAYTPYYARSLDRALETLAAGTRDGQIRYVVYQDALRVINRAMESAWTCVVAPFFYADRLRLWLPVIRPVLAAKSLPSYTRVPHIQRLIAQAPPAVRETEPVRAMTSLLDEWAPLVAQIQALKPLAVKARGPSAARPKNPNKIVRTCACCQRAAALTPEGLMAPHGYRRPGYGQQTVGCLGVQFPPWERSKAGGEAIRRYIAEELAPIQQDYERRETLTELSVVRRDRYGRLRAQIIQRTDPQWDAAYQSHVRDLVCKVDLYRKDLAAWDARLAGWHPTEPESAAPTPRRHARSGPSSDTVIR